MKTALITTTINRADVLAVYRQLGPEVMFFVTGDRKTPDQEVVALLEGGPHAYYGIDYQHKLGYKCSRLLGENNDSRRNIALLEALKWGAEIIVSIDDDMIPFDGFFEQIEYRFSGPFAGLQIGVPGKWVDAGQFTVPPAPQRGLPFGPDVRNSVSSIAGADIGIVQGGIFGVPDTDAWFAETNEPFITGASGILNSGFVAHPHAHAVFNSQFTAFSRELAPGFAQFYPWQKRNTDIFASLIMRRLARERDLYTFYGPPFGFHNRKPRDLMKDMQAEEWGVALVQRFADALNKWEAAPRRRVVDMTRDIYEDVGAKIMHPDNIACAQAFLDDCEQVL